LAAVLLCVTLCVILLSGCDVLKGLGFVPDDESDNGGQSEEPSWNGVPVWAELNNPSIKVKFGIDVNLTGTKAVDAAFHELSAFIKNDGLSSPFKVIKLGDWIDLEGGLSVEAYGEGEEYTGEFSVKNTDVDLTESPPFVNYEGKLLRLIVVGINSFHSEKGVENSYTISANDRTQHVVFQFQNIPVLRRMNETDTNEGGYAESEMRKYLVPVDGEGGNFLTGLQDAGVPKDVLWAPKRYVSNRGVNATKADEIVDLLWLPTEWEMFGSYITFSFSEHSSNLDYETVENQAWLEYYSDIYQGLHWKYYLYSESLYTPWNPWSYWESSPSLNSDGSTSFCYIGSDGRAYDQWASSAGGVAPAFCVQ
jgi:hypothetical protein